MYFQGTLCQSAGRIVAAHDALHAPSWESVPKPTDFFNAKNPDISPLELREGLQKIKCGHTSTLHSHTIEN
jgi:hypothetical protein